MAFTPGVKQHQNMARGEGISPDETFGCTQLKDSQGPAMSPPGMSRAGPTKDGDDRGAGKPVKFDVKKHPSQAQPDHGGHSGAGITKPSGRYGVMP